GGKRNEDGWDDLAHALQNKGYAVLTFDFRGHNDSTTIDPSVFWNLPINQRAFKQTKDKDRISQTEYVNSKTKYFYYPMLVNDIQAAKFFLDQQNDAGNCNSDNLIVIGAEEGAALGSLW